MNSDQWAAELSEEASFTENPWKEIPPSDAAPKH